MMGSCLHLCHGSWVVTKKFHPQGLLLSKPPSSPSSAGITIDSNVFLMRSYSNILPFRELLQCLFNRLKKQWLRNPTF